MLTLIAEIYSLTLPIEHTCFKIEFDADARMLVVTSFRSGQFFALFRMYMEMLLQLMTCLFYKKIKFKGKGYKIYKGKRNTFALQFGHTHRVFVYCFLNSVKTINKQTRIVYGTNPFDIQNAAVRLRA